MDAHPEGAKYAQRYNVYDYPHVAIIDPRTGRSMWKKEGWTERRPGGIWLDRCFFGKSQIPADLGKKRDWYEVLRAHKRSG